MIKSKIQLKVSNMQLKTLKKALVSSINTTVKMPKEIYKAMIAGIESQIIELEQEIKEYKKEQRNDSR